ncbi:MAG: hypothetical protein AVDCRST_MAG18-1928, partial [uncultured Thermomicrobiales bacterium]
CPWTRRAVSAAAPDRMPPSPASCARRLHPASASTGRSG